MAFSAPEGYFAVRNVQKNVEIGEYTPSSTGTEKYSTPVSLTISSPPGTPGRYTKVGSTMPLSPLLALISFSAKLYTTLALILQQDMTIVEDLPKACISH